jgi:hypothetical protein
VAVRRQLDAIGEPFLQIVNEVVCRTAVPCSDVPAGHKLGFRIQGRPSPDVAPSIFALVSGVVFFCLQPTNAQISSH